MTRPIDRRTFLRRAAIAGAGAVVVGLGLQRWRTADALPWDADAFPPPGEARVAVLRASSYDAGLEATVMEGLRAIGADVAGARVVLKPNLVEYDRNAVINTDPRLIVATALAMRRLGAADVTVADGPGHRRDTQYVATTSGVLAALDEEAVPFVDLNTDAIVQRRLRSHYTPFETLWLPATIADADVVVSMPKMKTHHWAGVTLSLKNCFGCVPGRVYGWPKNALHWAGIDQSILDVAGAVAPRLVIADGIVGMEGNGPITGSPVDAGVLVFGDDPVASDVIAATLMGLDPERVDHLAEAGRFLGQADRDRIRTEGEDPDSAITPFELLPQFAYLAAGSSAEPVSPLDAQA